MNVFIQFDRNQQHLLPAIHGRMVARRTRGSVFVIEVIDQLDLSKLMRRYSGNGSEIYHSVMILALLVYSYASGGAFSSRKIERVSYDLVEFQFIAANHHPNRDTLAHFCKTFLVELEGLFAQVMTLAQAMKLVKLGQISLDDTKIKANALQAQGVVPRSHRKAGKEPKVPETDPKAKD